MALLWKYVLVLIISINSQTMAENASKMSGEKKPNFVVLLVDDLGIGDVGCFGNDTLKTPNIDRLATMGAKLNHNLSPESICSPSRAATLTGRYAVRSGMAAGPGATRVLVNLGASGGLPNNETTFGKILRENGYKTSILGKWHQGLNCVDRNDNCHHPLNMGFDEFYGLPLTNLRDCGHEHSTSLDDFEERVKRILTQFLIACVSLAVALALTGIISKKTAFVLSVIALIIYFVAYRVIMLVLAQMVCLLMRGFDVVEQPVILENLTVKLTNEAQDFIQRNKDQRFLLFMSYVKVHTALFASPKFHNHSVHGRYGDNVEEMDWSVGEIVATLEENNILDNTFVYFTSDHGPDFEETMPSGEYCGGSNGQYRGAKGQSWEGGIRVPTVAVWKDHIPSGVEINEPTNTMDIFTTMVELAGGSVPTDRIIDGKNIFPLLAQEQSKSPHKFMFHYCGTAIHAVRYRPQEGNITWKAHFITPKWNPGTELCSPTLCGCFGTDVEELDPPYLYDITNDPYEQQQLDTSTHQDIINSMKVAIEKQKHGVKSVQNQLDEPHAQWNPSRQPCCNSPFCSCVEP